MKRPGKSRWQKLKAGYRMRSRKIPLGIRFSDYVQISFAVIFSGLNMGNPPACLGTIPKRKTGGLRWQDTGKLLARA